MPVFRWVQRFVVGAGFSVGSTGIFVVGAGFSVGSTGIFVVGAGFSVGLTGVQREYL